MTYLQQISRICTVLLLFLAAHNTSMAQLKKNSAYTAYIERYKDVAIEQMNKYNIPASITLAQGLLESGAGKSTLTVQGNNHFGIKCHGWTGQKMYMDDDEKDDCFRVYNNAMESYEDHSKFLKQQRYKVLFTYSRTDYKNWAYGLKQCGYATNPHYAQQLIDVIETYQLYQYDKVKAYNTFIVKHIGAATYGQPHTVQYNNHNYYVVVRPGDTFRSIGKEFDISYRKLAKYNERDRKEVLHDGDIIYLEKKRSKADKQYKKHPHVVRAGESMYSIAQKYGIRMKYLYKKNHLNPEFYTPRVGDELIVY